MKRKTGVSIILAMVLTASLLATGCGKSSGSGSSGSSGSSDDSVRIGLTADPGGFDPQVELDATAMLVMTNLYDTLINSKDGCSTDIQPQVAESWDVSEDALTYTFHLRDDVTFHNGKALTADDVVYSINRTATEPETASYCDAIDTVTADDDYTVTVKLKYAFANFLQNLGCGFFGIVDQEEVEASGDDYGRNPVGTGPYVFKEWVSGDSVTLEANEDYWGGAPEIKTITYKVLTDSSTAFIALENNEIDALPNADFVDVSNMDNDELTVYAAPSASYYHLGFNVTASPFDNEAVRQAINYALDKDAILQGANNGDGVVTNGPLNETMEGYDADEPAANDYDLDKAKELMAEAGYADGFDVTIKAISTDQKIGEVIQDQLKQININVNLDVMEKATFFEVMGSGDYEMYICSLNWPDADNMLTYLFDSEGPFNWAQTYSNPEIDELLVKARSSMDADERVEIYHQIVMLTDEDCNKIPLYFPNQYLVANQAVEGITVVDNCYFPVAEWSWAE